MKGITRRRTKVYLNEVQLRAALLHHCEKEYEETFGHKWNTGLATYAMDRLMEIQRRWQIETEAWAMRNEIRKVAEKTLDFFKSRGLPDYRPDNGLFHACRLHEFLEEQRDFLESIVDVRKEYQRPPDRRHWLAWTMNVWKPNPFAPHPYGRKLADRELAIISVLMTDASEIHFDTTGMTIGDALDQERRRITVARRRAPRDRKK